MPAKRKYRGPPGGTGLKKPKKFSAGTVSSKAYGPLGSSQKATLTWGLKIQVNPGTTFVFSANSVYDPNVSGVGHQPRGYDQLIALYDHAVVTKCKIEIWSVSVGSPLLLTTTVRDTSTVSADYRDQLEVNPSKHVMLGRNGYEGTYHSMIVHPNKFLGRASPLSDPDLKNSAVAGPKEQAYIHLSNDNFGGIAGDAAECFVKITYDAVFIEPRLPALS